MPVDRRWYWLGAALAAAGIALVAGLALHTLLYVAALLACPAAMFFGMAMMGGTENREQGAPPDHAFAEYPRKRRPPGAPSGYSRASWLTYGPTGRLRIT